MEPIGLNDTFTLVNTTLCLVLILLRFFYYRKNPQIDELIRRTLQIVDEVRTASKKIESIK